VGDFYFNALGVENYKGCLIFATKSKRVMNMYLLQVSTVAHDPNSSFWYLPVAIQLIFALIFVAGMMAVTHWLGPKRNTSDKLEVFTSGIKSHGDARQPMAIKYFLVAILFVLFDVEVIFFYPYAVNFKELGWSGFGAVLMFIAFFLVGFIYIIKKGALKWED
jgi:NADH-quinone oxidoreductase subunit A